MMYVVESVIIFTLYSKLSISNIPYFKQGVIYLCRSIKVITRATKCIVAVFQSFWPINV